VVAAVTEEVGSTTVLLVGALLIRLAAGGAYARYVRVGMGPWLLVAGILLAALGAAGVIHGSRRKASHSSRPFSPGRGVIMMMKSGRALRARSRAAAAVATRSARYPAGCNMVSSERADHSSPLTTSASADGAEGT